MSQITMVVATATGNSAKKKVYGGPRGTVGPRGDPGLDTGDTIDAHVADTNPHPNAHSGRDFAALFTNGLI